MYHACFFQARINSDSDLVLPDSPKCDSRKLWKATVGSLVGTFGESKPKGPGPGFTSKYFDSMKLCPSEQLQK